MTTVILHARMGDGLFTVTVMGHTILAVVPEDGSAKISHAPADRMIDLHGDRLLPGLCDIHTHGCMGCDTMDGNHLAVMAEAQLSHGITSFFPTTMTESPARIAAALTQPLPATGAKVVGFHMEGPYINPRYKGAQNEAYIKAPDLAAFSAYPQAKIVTIAPEAEGAADFIRGTRACVSLGHTACDYDTAMTAFRAGARCLTHVCNAMPPFLHRAPGPIGAAIDADAYVQVICDGNHLHRSMITMLYRTFGARRMILISDSMPATGMGDGVYAFGGQEVTVSGGVARTADGALAGSTSNLMDCVRCAIALGIPAEDAFRMASTTPAEMLGLKKGKIAPGYDAEMLVMDENYALKRVLVM